MNDDLCDFRHKKFDFSYSTGGIEVIGKVYTAREVDKRDFQVIIKLLEDNDWKLEVETLFDGHYIGNGIRSMGPFTTKSMVKTVKKIWKEKKKMNSVFGRIANLAPTKESPTITGSINACSPKTVEPIVDRGFKNKKEYVIYKKN